MVIRTLFCIFSSAIIFSCFGCSICRVKVNEPGINYFSLTYEESYNEN